MHALSTLPFAFSISFADEKQREREFVEGELRKMITRAAESCASRKGFEKFCVESKDIEEFFREELRVEPVSEDQLCLLYEYHGIHKCSRAGPLEEEPGSRSKTDIVKSLSTERARDDQHLDNSKDQVGESRANIGAYNYKQVAMEAKADFRIPDIEAEIASACTENEVSSQRSREAGKGPQSLPQTENEFELEAEIKIEDGAKLTYRSSLADNMHFKMLEAKADRDYTFRVYLSNSEKQGKPASNLLTESADDTCQAASEEEGSNGNFTSSISGSFYWLLRNSEKLVEKVVRSTVGGKQHGNTELMSAMEVFSQYDEEDSSMWRKEGRYVCHKFEYQFRHLTEDMSLKEYQS